MRSLLLRVLPLALALSATGCDVLFGTGDKADDGYTASGDTATTPHTTTPPITLDGECDRLFDTPSPGGGGLPSCVTEEISCGDIVRGTLAGGSTSFSNEPDRAWEQCSGQGPFGDDLTGPERVYKLDVGTNTYASVHLVSCERTQLLWYQTAQECPQEHVACSYVTVDGSTDQQEDIVLGGSGILWFVVEGLAGSDGNYILSVECGST